MVYTPKLQPIEGPKSQTERQNWLMITLEIFQVSILLDESFSKIINFFYFEYIANLHI